VFSRAGQWDLIGPAELLWPWIHFLIKKNENQILSTPTEASGVEAWIWPRMCVGQDGSVGKQPAMWK
jgi:hypothetical protein